MSESSPTIGVVGVPGGWSSKRLVDAFRNKSIDCLLVDMAKVCLDLHTRQADCEGRSLSTLDALVIKKIGAEYSADLLDRLAMLRYVSSRGPKIFSRPEHIKRVIDRLSCTVTLRIAGIPMPATIVTEDIDQAVIAVENFGRAILKPLYTTKARGMEVVEYGPETVETLRRFQSAGNPVLYIQKMLTIQEQDLGLAFLGGSFLGCYARVRRKGAWNTTTPSGGKYRAYEPSDEIIDLAYRAQSLFDLDFTSVDIVETKDGPMVFEVSAFGGFRGLLDGNNIDAASLYADYVLSRL